MKKVKLLFTAAVMAGIIACGGPDRGAEKSMKELRSYLDSVERDHANYLQDETYWANVEKGYEEKKQQLDAKTARMDEKSKKDYEELQHKYGGLKEKHTAEQAKMKEKTSAEMALRNSLFGEGRVGKDMSFTFMTPSNAVSVYETFVNTVSKNRETYTKENWEEVKELYKAMNTRKDEIEKELTRKDKDKIAGLRVRFTAIKDTHKPFSKHSPESKK